MRAEPQAFQVQRMASARLQRQDRLTPAPRSRSLKPSSDGRAARWPPFTHVKPTGAASHLRQCTRSRTTSELLLSHLSARCDTQSEKTNNNTAKFFEWCGREETEPPLA